MDTELHNAISANDLEAVTRLVKAGASINKLHGMKGTPLCAAIASNKIDIVRYFIQQEECDVNLADFDGEPPLCLAISKNRTDIAKVLIDFRGCNLNVEDPIQKKTALCIAICEGNREIVEYLLKAGCNVNKISAHGTPPVHYAVTDSRLDLVELLVNNGVSLLDCNNCGHNALHHSIYHEDVKCTELLLHLIEKDEGKKRIVDSTTVIRNDSCLHIAVDVGSVVLTEMLLQFQSNINILNNLGHSPLFAAVRNNSTDLVSCLLKGGADPGIEGAENVRGHYQTRPRKLSALHVAVSNGNLDIVKLLVENGTRINVVDFRGNNALMVALHHNKANIAKYLLESSKIDVLMRNHMNENCLFAAISCADPAWFVRELVKRGCSVNQRNSENLTPLHLAVDNDCTEVTDVLLENGGDVNALTNEDYTHLHTCASAGYTDIIRLLLLYGANIDAENEDKQTPLAVAIDCENYETAAILLDCGASSRWVLSEYQSVANLIREKIQDEEWEETLTRLLQENLSVPKLQLICRRSVTRYFAKKKLSLKNIPLLPVPTRTIQYLNFRC